MVTNGLTLVEMAEELENDAMPDLKELENKVGRKTPESLVTWMKDAARGEETWRADVHDQNLNHHMSAKINHLKQEMRGLRAMDVHILRQLVAVHEGVEAVRWLVEERGACASLSSSLTGSVSSLTPLDEPGLPRSRCRDSLTSAQDWTEDSGEDLGHSPHTADVVGHKNDLSLERPPSVFSAHNSEVSSSPKDGRPQHSDTGHPDPVRMALLRCSRISRREEEKPSHDLSKRDGNVEGSRPEIELQTFGTKRTNADTTVQEEDNMLLGYDAQWCWVESQDDVTFL